MKRLCIYMTYSKENKLYEYIGRVLKSLKACCSKVYLVCNYKGMESGLEHVSSYIDGIFFRENKGYDSGAYKDALCEFLGWDEVYQFDELLLVNDSFFGFFYPLQDTFYLMDEFDSDFWGMTGQAAGEYSNPTYKYDAHVHSYFLVFKKKIFTSEVFRTFWEEFVYPENFRQAVVNFEIGICNYLEQHGFKGKSYIDVYDISLQANENPYYSMIDKLVRDYKVPIMKKKSLLIRNVDFAKVLNTIVYLEERNMYPINWILPYLDNQFYIPGIGGEEPCNSLEIFYKSHPEIYIYGAGVCGKNLAIYFDYKGWQYKGFIVTNGVNTVSIEETEINSDTGIITVMNPEVADEIKKYIGDRCRREQLFLISDCNAIKLPD